MKLPRDIRNCPTCNVPFEKFTHQEQHLPNIHGRAQCVGCKFRTYENCAEFGNVYFFGFSTYLSNGCFIEFNTFDTGKFEVIVWDQYTVDVELELAIPMPDWHEIPNVLTTINQSMMFL
jgi:hypothetical protein